MGRLGIVTALPAEAASLARVGGGVSPSGNRLCSRVDIERGAIGRDRAAEAAERLVHRGATCLLSWGVAGGLDPRLPAGRLVVPLRVRGGDGRSYLVDRDWHHRVCRHLVDMAFETGVVLESSHVLAKVDDKATAFRETGAVAVDMESVGVVGIAERRGVPALVMRAIVDTAGKPLPELTSFAMRADGRTSVSALISGSIRRPWELLGLIEVGLAYRSAVRTLSATARRLGPDFACPA